MLEFKGKPFVMALEGLYNAIEIATKDIDWFGKEDRLSSWLDVLRNELTSLGCSQTIKKLDYIKLCFALPNYTPANKLSLFKSQFGELRNRLEDELEDQVLYCLTAREAEALQPVALVYGEAVEACFNDELFDLEEASKAIAFARGTAAVFHLMRAMEGAVKRAGKKLDATIVGSDNNDLEWGKIISNTKIKVENMEKGAARDEWSEVLSLLYHVKQAWRNSTMHPKQTYTLEEAGEVLAAVRSFLRRLAPLV